jgi:hypothetical protein
MNHSNRLKAFGHFVLVGAAFIVSVLSVSNLMPLLFDVVTKGISLTEGLLIAGYLIASTVAIAILARDMYRLDKKAGRIRNRVRWFE